MIIMKKTYSSNTYIFLFAVTYMVSYLTRVNYGAIISAMEADLGWQKTILSAAVTGSFISYGIMQIFSGILGDKISPRKLVGAGLIVTVLMNMLIPFCRNAFQMTAVWCINGAAQSFMWPPIVRIEATIFNIDEFSRSNVCISLGGSMGTLIIYLISPLIISMAGWRYVFVFSAVCGIIMLIFWLLLCPEIEGKRTEAVEEKKPRGEGRFFSSLIICTMAAIALQGMLRDGVTTWMPSYITEVYKLKNTVSILSGVVLPIFGIICLNSASLLYRKKIPNPQACAGTIFAVGAFSALMLMAVFGKSAALSVLFAAILTGSMHGVNLLLVCMIPVFYKEQGRVSTVSGMLNACTYAGSALSAYGIALLIEKFDWSFTLTSWFVTALAGTVICFSLIKKWNAFVKSLPR